MELKMFLCSQEISIEMIDPLMWENTKLYYRNFTTPRRPHLGTAVRDCPEEDFFEKQTKK